MSFFEFDKDGNFKRERGTPCKQCGAMRHCDACWEHVHDYSRFHVWHCLLCRMPMASYGHPGEAHLHRCYFCGWDEATETKSMKFDKDGNYEIVPHDPNYPRADPQW